MLVLQVVRVDGLQLVTVAIIVVGGGGGVQRHLHIIVAHVREIVSRRDGRGRMQLMVLVVDDDAFRMTDVLERVFENLIWDCIIVIITTGRVDWRRRAGGNRGQWGNEIRWMVVVLRNGVSVIVNVNVGGVIIDRLDVFNTPSAPAALDHRERVCLEQLVIAVHEPGSFQLVDFQEGQVSCIRPRFVSKGLIVVKLV